MAPKEMTSDAGVCADDHYYMHPQQPLAGQVLPPQQSATDDNGDNTTDVESCSGSDSEATTMAKKMKKRLRWSTITVHEFGVGFGGSSVPSKGGPAIGLADKPEFTWTTKVGEMAECSEGVHRFNAEERVRLLQTAGESDGMILRFSRETNIILTSRRRTLVEDIAEQKTKAKKRKAEPVTVHERPCTAFLSRPRMIPANYA